MFPIPILALVQGQALGQPTALSQLLNQLLNQRLNQLLNQLLNQKDHKGTRPTRNHNYSDLTSWTASLLAASPLDSGSRIIKFGLRCGEHRVLNRSEPLGPPSVYLSCPGT